MVGAVKFINNPSGQPWITITLWPTLMMGGDWNIEPTVTWYYYVYIYMDQLKSSSNEIFSSRPTRLGWWKYGMARWHALASSSQGPENQRTGPPSETAHGQGAMSPVGKLTHGHSLRRFFAGNLTLGKSSMDCFPSRQTRISHCQPANVCCSVSGFGAHGSTAEILFGRPRFQSVHPAPFPVRSRRVDYQPHVLPSGKLT